MHCYKNAIDTIFLHVTKECNLRCRYCYFSAQRPLPDELTTRELVGLWGDLISVNPKKVIFTGGEPLVRRDIFVLLRSLRSVARENSIRICINTNGHYTTATVAKRLAGLVDEVRVSIDALAERNDGLRGKGSFVSAMRAIEALCTAGLPPKILITVTKHSLPDLENLLCLIVSAGLKKIKINRFRPIGRGAQRLDWCVSEAEVEGAIEQAWRRLNPTYSPPAKKLRNGCQHTCGVGRFINIMPNGEVFPCHVLTQREFLCGNVRDERLSTICRSDRLLGKLAALDFRQLQQVDLKLTPLTVEGACMGEVYEHEKSSPAWYAAIGKSEKDGDAK